MAKRKKRKYAGAFRLEQIDLGELRRADIQNDGKTVEIRKLYQGRSTCDPTCNRH
jgi:hypothetical protein